MENIDYIDNIDFELLKQKVLPYYVEVYGEEYRDLIIDRLNRVVPIFYKTLDQKIAIYQYEMLKKRKELTINFLEYNNIFIDEKTKIEYINSKETIFPESLIEGKNLLELYFGDYIYKRNPSKEKTQVFEENYKIDSYIIELNSKYDEFDSKFNNLRVAVKESNLQSKQIFEHNMLEFLQSIEEYISQSDKEKIKNYNNSSSKEFDELREGLDIIKLVGKNFNYGPIDFFSSNQNKKLNNLKTNDAVRENIINNRINYFKSIGKYDEKMEPEEFLKSDIAISATPSQLMIEDIIVKKQHYAKLMSREYFKSKSNARECISKISKHNMVNLNAEEYFLNNEATLRDLEQANVYITLPTVVLNNDNVDLALLLTFPGESTSYLLDICFIHEMNHAIRTNLLSYENGNISFKNGFEFLPAPLPRRYERFSGAVNFLIATKTAEAMHKDGVYLFNTLETAKISSIDTMRHEHQIVLIEKFFETFKKEIIMANLGNDLDVLYKVVGKENFESLNNIVNEHDDIRIQYLKKDINDKEANELINRRFELEIKANEIYELMIQHAGLTNNYENQKYNGRKI